jgi:hypothetical protein
MKAYTLQVGDMIQVGRFLYNHVGIYVGSRTADGRDVVHNDKNGGVVLSTLAEFSGGKPVQLHTAASGNYVEREAIANRALSLLGRRFDLLTFNCEHAANWAQSGKLESPQIKGFVLFALIVGGLALVARRR